MCYRAFYNFCRTESSWCDHSQSIPVHHAFSQDQYLPLIGLEMPTMVGQPAKENGLRFEGAPGRSAIVLPLPLFVCSFNDLTPWPPDLQIYRFKERTFRMYGFKERTWPPDKCFNRTSLKCVLSEQFKYAGLDGRKLSSSCLTLWYLYALLFSFIHSFIHSGYDMIWCWMLGKTG